MSAPLRIQLSWPARELSPNVNVHHMVEHRFKKAARTEAGWATKFAMQSNRDWQPDKEPLPIHLIAHPPEAWRTGDRDNLIAQIKSHLDSIANVIGVNDRDFDAPTVEWADRCAHGKLIVVVG